MGTTLGSQPVQKTILEKDRPVADIFLSSDIARLIDITEAGANVEIPFQKNVPSNLQTSDWTSLPMRARVIYAHNDLQLEKISYEDLILPKYKDRVCTRSGYHPYNISLFSALIAHHGQRLAGLAEQAGVRLKFEAAVAGGIPALKVLREGLAGNDISRVTGILSQMQEATVKLVMNNLSESIRQMIS